VSGRFSVKSAYNQLTKNDDGPSFRVIWKAKLPEKIAQRAIVTKDNMIRRNYHGDPSCYFCGDSESTGHLLFQCPIAKTLWEVVAVCFQQRCRPQSWEQFECWIVQALPGGESFCMMGLVAVCWAIWKARNRTCFEKKPINCPREILYSACFS
jgi:hypothetical protein